MEMRIDSKWTQAILRDMRYSKNALEGWVSYTIYYKIFLKNTVEQGNVIEFANTSVEQSGCII